MKRVIVLSDTHGDKQAIKRIESIINESDYVFHLGDYYRDMLWCKKAVYVSGNCDATGINQERVVEVEGVKFLLCHGHVYGVKSDLTRLSMRAEELSADCALFGHTHIPDIIKSDKVSLINPGSLSQNVFGKRSYAYIVVHGDKFSAKIVEI